MQTLVLPYGNAGWKEKKLVLEEVLSSLPRTPFVYNDVLIIVPSSRMKRMYGRLFLEFAGHRGSAALVQPDVQTLHQFLQKLYGGLNGPRLMDENSRLILLEGIVKNRLSGSSAFSLSPDLLAPSLSSALAKMIEQLSGAGISAEDLSLRIQGSEFFDKPQVQLLIDAYTRYESALRATAVTDPAGMLAFLRDRFDPAWLARYRRIIIDGIQGIGLLEAELLKKVANSGQCTCLVDAPSAEMLNRAGDFHPLRIVKDSLAQIGGVPTERDAAADEEQRYLASALFSDRPFSEAADKAPGPSSFARTINLLSALNIREEVTFIAGEVKKALKAGMPADSVLVTFPALDEYGPLVEEIFNDYGIPYNRALGRQLSSSLVATAVVSLLRACQEDYSGPSLLRIFSSPLLKFSEHAAIAPALDRLMRANHIIGGKQKLLAALIRHASDENNQDILLAPLQDLFAALEPFAARDAAPLSSWMDRLSALLAWSGLGARVALIKGPLNINLQAYKKMTETLASLCQAGKTFPEYCYTFNEWLFLLKKTFMHTRFQVPPEDEGGVQVLGLEESFVHPWKQIYFGGLVDSKFPQRLPQNIFLPEQTLEAMGVRTLESARLNAACHFYRLLLSADTVVLTYPENEGDRPVVPSPFLKELTPLMTAGLLNRGIDKTSGIQFSLRIEDSRSIPELAKAISVTGERKGLAKMLDSGIEGTAGIKAALAEKRAETAPVIAPPPKREFWVTELDEYIQCPYDYYVKYVLRAEPLEEPTEDLSAMDRGSKVHAILRNFYLSWNMPVTEENRYEAQALLNKLADSAFDREADTFRNRRGKEFFLSVMAKRFLDAEEEFWKHGMRPAFLEQKIERYPLLLSNGETVELSAKIDRIDVDRNGNFVIVDYKTGKYPLPMMSIDQDIFQLPLYAVMAQQALPDNGPAIKKPIGLAYYDLSGKTGAGARDVVLFDKEERDDHPSSKPKASPKSTEDFEEILKRSTDKARTAIEGILAHRFPSRPQHESTCRNCPNEMMCEEE